MAYKQLTAGSLCRSLFFTLPILDEKSAGIFIESALVKRTATGLMEWHRRKLIKTGWVSGSRSIAW